MFPAERSPWIHTGDPAQAGVRSAASHAAVAASVSIMPRSDAIAARVASSRSASGTPRYTLCSPGEGPPVASTVRSATTKRASATASARSSPASAVVGFAPGSHGHTDHGQGYPAPGAPTATGTGTGSGSSGASRGSHRRSFRTWGTTRSIRGSRATRSAPIR